MRGETTSARSEPRAEEGEDVARGRRPRRGARAQRVAAILALAAAVAAVMVLVRAAGVFRAPDKPSRAEVSPTPAASPASIPPTPSGTPRPHRQRICAWSRGDSAALERAAAAHAIDEVAFDWYHSRRNGTIETEGENMALVHRAHELGLTALATITNRLDHTSPFDPHISGPILASSATRTSHIDRLVRLCVRRGYDGVDLDWEELRAGDRARFTSFVRELAGKLHARGKILSIAVYPKTSEPGDYDAQRAQDYAALGAVVDEFKVMTYSFSGSWGPPGPQMPLAWAQRVLSFAQSKVPADKVFMGLPFFGFDWSGGSARYVLWRDVRKARGTFGGRLTRDSASGEAILDYSDAGGAAHTVYHQDSTAVRVKIAWMKSSVPDIAGVAIWVMGGEDPRFWQVLAAELDPRP